MAFTNTVVKESYQGDGVTVTFAIPSIIVVSSQNEVKVYLRDEGVDPATETLLTYTTDYTISGANVIMNTAPQIDEVLVIARELPFTQTLDLITSGAFLPESHELALDRIVAMIQQIDERLDRVPIAQITNPLSEDAFNYGDPVANTVIGWDDTAEQVVLYAFTDITASLSNDLADHLADATDAHDSSAISVVPSGNLASTDVQSALLELQANIDLFFGTAALGGGYAVITNGSGKLTTSGVTSTELGYLSGASSNLQTQISALSSTISVHIASTSAHTAAHISVVPTGNLASSNVQAALEELQTDIDSFSSGAPTGAQYVVLALHASLSGERVLTGTANQVIITDGGANGNVTLSLPQSIDSGATVQFQQLKLLGASAGEIRFYEAGGSNYNAFKSPALSSDYTYIWPSSFPASDKVLQSDSSGNLSWVTAGSGGTSSAQFLTLALDGSLTDERVFTPGTGLSAVDGGAGGLYTLNVTITQYTDEMAQDTVATLIQNGTGISWVYSDAGNTLTPTISLSAFSTTNLSEGTNLYYTDERVDDRVAALIQNGTGLTWTYSDAGGTLTGNVSLSALSGALNSEAYVTIGNTAGLTSERALTGTSNQITITDNGAGSTVVLSLPQNIHTGAGPTFTGLTLSGLTEGSVVFAGASGVISQDNSNFFWDNTNKGLAIGQNTTGINVNSVAVNVSLTLDMASDLVGQLTHVHNSTATIAANNVLAKSRGTHGSPTIVVAGDTIGILAGYGYSGNVSVGYLKAAQIRFNVASGTISTTSMPGQIEFYTTPDTTVTPARALLVDQNKQVTMDAYGTGIAHFSSAGLISSSTIVNADVSASAAIAITKIANGTANQLIGANAGATANEFKTLSGTSNQVTVTHGVGTITLATPQDIATGSSPTFSGLTLSSFGTGIVHSSVAGVLSSSLIVNADVSSSAAIAITKIANGTANQLIKANAGATANEFATLSGGTGLSVTFGVGTIALANTGVTSIVAGTAISISGATGAVTVNNTGVTSATGTANQITVSAATGAVTFSTPQNIHTGATPTFAGLTLSGLTSTGVLYNASGLIKTEAAFAYDETNNILYVPEIAGGSTTSSNLMVSAYSNTFDDTNTGRIQFMERMTFNNSWTATGSGGTLNDTLLKFTGTLTSALAINIVPSISDTRTFRYSTSQTVSAFWTFLAGTIYQPTAAVTDTVGYTQYAGFVARPQFAPDIASGTAQTDRLIGFASSPMSRKINAGTVAITNVYGFGTNVTPGIFSNELENATITNLYHFSANNPNTSGVTLTNHIAFYVPALNLGTNRYGYYSDLTASANYWDIYSTGGAQSSHEGLFKFGDNVAPTALVHTTGSTTARSSMRIEGGTAPTTPNSGDLWHDSTRQCLQVYCGGMTQGVQKVIYTQTATQTIGGTGTETTLFGTGIGTNTLAANFLNIGKTIRCKIWGHYSTKAAPVGSLDIRVKLGSTTLLTLTGTLTASLTSEAFFIEAIITCRTTGATGTVFAQGWTNLGETAGTPFTFYVANTATSTIDTTASQAFDITWDWTTSSASNTVSSTNSITEVAF